jgi:hypothetical protein
MSSDAHEDCRSCRDRPSPRRSHTRTTLAQQSPVPAQCSALSSIRRAVPERIRAPTARLYAPHWLPPHSRKMRSLQALYDPPQILQSKLAHPSAAQIPNARCRLSGNSRSLRRFPHAPSWRNVGSGCLNRANTAKSDSSCGPSRPHPPHGSHPSLATYKCAVVFKFLSQIIHYVYRYI